MTRILLIASLLVTAAVPALAFDPQPDPPKSLAGDGSVKTNTGSIRLGDGSVRTQIGR